LLASSGGRSRHGKSHKVLYSAAITLDLLVDDDVVVAVPTDPQLVGKYMVGPDTKKLGRYGTKRETRLRLRPMIQFVARFSNGAVFILIVKAAAHHLESWFPLLTEGSLEATYLSIEQ
jgi:hypothetical protein